MNRTEYEELKRVDLSVVKETIREGLGIKLKKEWDYWTYYIFLAYILWKVKREPEADVIETLTNLIYEKGGIMMPLDDICYDFLEENDRMNKLKELALNMEEDDLAAYVLYGSTQEYDDPVPRGITTLANKYLKMKKNGKSTILYSATGTAMVDTFFDYPQYECSIVSDEYVFLDIAIIKADVIGFEKLKCYFDPEEDELEFDKIFIPCLIEPTVKERHVRTNYVLDNCFQEYPSSYTNYWNYIGEALYYARNGGKVVSLMVGGALTGNYGKEVREFLVKNGYLEKVIILPEKLYQTTWINAFMLVLGKGNKKVSFIDARECFKKDRMSGKRINVIDEEDIEKILSLEGSEKEVVVSNDEIIHNDCILSPLRYISSNIEMDCVKFGDCIKEIKRGAMVSGKDMDLLYTEVETKYKCIFPSGIVDGVIKQNVYFNGEQKTYEGAKANQGDLILVRSGNPYKVAIADEECMIAGNLYAISIDKSKINPMYVKCYLESEKGQKELYRLSTGSKTPIISISNLMQIDIPVYPEKTQNVMDEKSERLIVELHDCYKRIDEIKRQMQEMFE